MVKIDLVTGFLGTGKTTFIKKYAKYLIDQGKHVGIIENDFGAINIDMLLLQDIEGEECELEPIVGGNVASDWKRRFKAKLILFSLQGIDRVIVEPSGIYDVDTFLEAMCDEQVSSRYEIGNIFALVDSKMDERLSNQAEYLLVSQVANSGKVVFSKIQNSTTQEIEKTTSHIKSLLDEYNCDEKIDDKLFIKDWDKLKEADFEELVSCGWKNANYKHLQINNEEVFDTLFFMHVKMPESEIENRIKKLINENIGGTIFRIKGLFANAQDGFTEVNATKEHFEMKKLPKGQEVVIVIGENLDNDKISSYFEA